MYFPWNKYIELPTGRRNTLQIFVTNRCNLRCDGCFARFIMKENNLDISLWEYDKVIKKFLAKSGQQINILGGEPLLHPKLRVSLYCKTGAVKSVKKLAKTNIPFDICYMVSRKTTIKELLETANYLEKNYNSRVFFISSIRELDNPKKEFFEDTKITMNLLKYKELVHKFLDAYEGNMEIHISKRGMFESTRTLAENKCRFANYFIGGQIIQCPYDVVNLKFQSDYNFEARHCQQNNTCLMSKIILKKR